MKTKLFLISLLFAARVFGATDDWRQIWDGESNAKWRAKPQSELTTLAESGNPVAMVFLAGKLRAAKNHQAAQAWDNKAAQAGLPQALTEKAEDVGAEDLKEAMPMLEQAASTGYPLAKVALADVFIAGRADKKGFVVKADSARAIELLQQAADEYSVAAMTKLAQQYSCGVGEPRSENDRPIILWARAANGGDLEAMKELARRRRFGLGADKDILSAANWAFRARTGRLISGSAKEEAPTEWVGTGNTEDDETLRQLSKKYEAAFRQRSLPALLELAAWHVASSFGKPNLPRAIALYTLAERRGDPSAQSKRKDLESKLDDEGRKTLQRELEWMAFASEEN